MGSEQFPSAARRGLRLLRRSILEREEPVLADAGGVGDDLLKVPGQYKEHSPLNDEDDPDSAHLCPVTIDVRELHANRVLVCSSERILAQFPQTSANTSLLVNRVLHHVQ